MTEENESNIWSNQWHRSLIPGNVVLSSRQRYVTRPDGAGVYVEDIVLETRMRLDIERGSEMVLPIRKRK